MDGGNRISIPMSQIESLIQLSEFCDQEFRYDCTLAPLTNEGVDYAFWEDRSGGLNNYFTGAGRAIEMFINIGTLNPQEAITTITFATVTMRLMDVMRKKQNTTPATATLTFLWLSPTPAPSPTPPHCPLSDCFLVA